MRTRVRKSAMTLLAVVLLLSQSACNELYYRYSAILALTYLTAMSLSYHSALYNAAMVSNTPPSQGSVEPGSSTPHTIVMSPPGQSLLTRSILLSLSTAYVFNGFNALQGSLGEYRIVDPNSSQVLLAPILALSATAAFIDLNHSGAHEAQYEPLIQWLAVSATVQAFLITFPAWGGGPANNAAYNLTDFAVLTLFAGLLTNPLVAGTYQHNYTFTSVDPESGGDDDHQGEPPRIRTLSIPVIVAEVVRLRILTHILQLLLEPRR